MSTRPGGGSSNLLLQVESAISCNISCVMCPWKRERAAAGDGLMGEVVWAALRPYLGAFRLVDLSGGGEPLLNPDLPARLAEAVKAGCETGFLTNGTLLDSDKAAEILDIGPHWLGVSLDGATASTYESVRKGATFQTVTGNIRRLSKLRKGERPELIVQCVIMPVNAPELPDVVRLAADLGASRVVLKNCDVVRTEAAQSAAVYKGGGGEGGRSMRKLLKAAAKAAKKAGIELRTYSMVPEEEPVCEQDPRRSLFVAYDGRVSPCIGLAYGGEGVFFGEKVNFPSVVFGRLPDNDLMELRETAAAVKMRDAFERRVVAYDRALSRIDGDMDLIKFKRLLGDAVEAMPPAPEGCDRCHYLYGV